MSFLKEFESKYSHLLDYKINWQKRKCLPNLHQRSKGFRLIFSLLEKLKKDEYQIVETGVLRKLGNWRDAVETTPNYDNALEECRKANRDYWTLIQNNL
jgi:hypothetical protein